MKATQATNAYVYLVNFIEIKANETIIRNTIVQLCTKFVFLGEKLLDYII